MFQLTPLCYPLHKALGQIILWRLSRWMTSPARYLSSVFYLLFIFGGLLIFFTSFSLLCIYYNTLIFICQALFLFFSFGACDNKIIIKRIVIVILSTSFLYYVFIITYIVLFVNSYFYFCKKLFSISFVISSLQVL